MDEIIQQAFTKVQKALNERDLDTAIEGMKRLTDNLYYLNRFQEEEYQLIAWRLKRLISEYKV